ncbi:hypothetical protein LCGC14_1745320 [marine sediment metagenome]|uniref:Uncharacterized protein n=1 Tax=marine sediment metagenome TaxID=412755 RepID=A0A0F9H5J1_9ZZZZ
MIYNKGYEIQKAMTVWFKGKSHPEDCVDFQTKTTLYEVKSCNLLVKCINGNSNRPFKFRKHKKISTTQLGRFVVKVYNHNDLFKQAKEEEKLAKYIFVIVVGNQKIWKVVSWNEVDKFVNNKKRTNQIQIKKIFKRIRG